MRKTSFLLIGLVLSLTACSPAFFLKPKEDFDAGNLAEAPDYSSAEAWAALPGRDSQANLTPPGATDGQAEAPVDVFFIYPTVWMDRRVWNDPLDSEKSREMLEEIILPGQASVFNECCRIFVPLYRQATIGAYFVDSDEAHAAFTIAVEDLERAFHTFLEEHNDGRPFILAGHSQGSMHAMRLLERIDGDPELRRRMVAAYIPGYSLPLSHYATHYEHIQSCDSPYETGCIVSWDTYREGNTPDGAEPLHYWHGEELYRIPTESVRQCTNPITWRSDEEPSDRDAHLGAVTRINEGNSPSFFRVLRADGALGFNTTGLNPPRSQLISARCHQGALFIDDLRRLDYDPPQTSRGNYHLGDYELFYMDIRHNAQLRTSTWLENAER